MDGISIKVTHMIDTKILEIPGRMLSHSKSVYRSANPGHLVFWNANLFADSEKVWWGDIDLTMDRENLKTLAKDNGCTIQIFMESDGRNEQDDYSSFADKFVYKVSSDGTEEIGKEHSNRVNMETLTHSS